MLSHALCAVPYSMFRSVVHSVGCCECCSLVAPVVLREINNLLDCTPYVSQLDGHSWARPSVPLSSALCLRASVPGGGLSSRPPPVCGLLFHVQATHSRPAAQHHQRQRRRQLKKSRPACQTDSFNHGWYRAGPAGSASCLSTHTPHPVHCLQHLVPSPKPRLPAPIQPSARCRRPAPSPPSVLCLCLCRCLSLFPHSVAIRCHSLLPQVKVQIPSPSSSLCSPRFVSLSSSSHTLTILSFSRPLDAISYTRLLSIYSAAYSGPNSRFSFVILPPRNPLLYAPPAAPHRLLEICLERSLHLFREKTFTTCHVHRHSSTRYIDVIFWLQTTRIVVSSISYSSRPAVASLPFCQLVCARQLEPRPILRTHSAVRSIAGGLIARI